MNDLDGITFVHIRNEFKNKRSSLDIAFFLVGEDDFTLDDGGNAGLEAHGERNTLAWLNSDLLFLN